MAVIISKQLVVPEAPVKGTLASDLAEGGIVLIPENGVNVEFYVAKHDYESGLNGAGRTLFVRKDCYDSRQWSYAYQNSYSGSLIDVWLDGDYKSLLGAEVQSLLGSTKFYCAVGMRDTTIATLSRGVFCLSATELNLSDSNSPVEGSALPISDTLRIAYYNGSAVGQWTRSSRPSSTAYAYGVWADGTLFGDGVADSYYSRPAFTLPSNALFDPDTGEFLGVA